MLLNTHSWTYNLHKKWDYMKPPHSMAQSRKDWCPSRNDASPFFSHVCVLVWVLGGAPFFIRQIRVERRCKSGVPLPAAATTFDTELLALAETNGWTTAALYRYTYHRYLMTRLSIQVFYLWRHVLSTAPLFILWWSNLEILFSHLYRSSPFIRGLRCQAIQTEHGPYITERTPKAVYSILWGVYDQDSPLHGS
jgi:hypothetical protein